MKHYKAIAVIAVSIFCCFNQAKAQVVKKIGTQIWTIKNLDVSTFRNGDVIPEVKTAAEWIKACENDQPAWCYYGNDPANGKKYGKLYNWYAVNDKRGLAPEGWHVPSEEEFTTLINYLGGKAFSAQKMMSTSGWKIIGNKKGNNSSGFSGLPGGYRDANGLDFEIRETGVWWCSQGNTGRVYASDRRVSAGRTDVYSLGDFGKCGFSVRCVKD